MDQTFFSLNGEPGLFILVPDDALSVIEHCPSCNTKDLLLLSSVICYGESFSLLAELQVQAQTCPLVTNPILKKT